MNIHGVQQKDWNGVDKLEAKATMVYWWSWDKETLQEESNYYVSLITMPRKKVTIAWKRGVMHKK